MLQSQDSIEKESYEEEAKLSRDRENSLAASASSYSDDLDEDSKAKVGACLFVMRATGNSVHPKHHVSRELQSLTNIAIVLAKELNICRSVLKQEQSAGMQVLLLLNVQAADMERAREGKKKKERADRDALKHSTLARSFLGLFRKDNETEKPSQQEATPRSWSLPIPFWKRT